MLLFAHTGITTGVALLTQKLIDRRKRGIQYTAKLRNQEAGVIDFRLLLLGSLLPDIIDKPVGIFFFNDEIGNGRIFSHTLLFFIVITGIAVWLCRWKQNPGMAAVAFGVFTHLLLDSMWVYPLTLFWPLLGNFEKSDTGGWLQDIWRWLFTEPEYYIPEIIGLAILVPVSINVLKKRRLGVFFRDGRV